jgi:hypothetical protein
MAQVAEHTLGTGEVVGSTPPVGSMKRHGQSWDKWDGDGWMAVIDRYSIGVWPFGEPRAWCVKIYIPYPTPDKEVGIFLGDYPTMENAMRVGIKWVKEYKPATMDETLKRMFREYKTLFRTLADAYGQLFFTVGGGYDWLDGALVRRNQEPDPGKHFRQDFSNAPKEIQDAVKAVKAREDALSIGPVADPGGDRYFYPLSATYSNVCNVPDDACEDWALAAYNAAVMYRDRAAPSEDTFEDQKRYKQCRRLAEGIRVDLANRFNLS